MKKLRLLLAAVILCGALFTGCDEEKTEVKKDKNESAVSTEETAAEKTEKYAETETQKVNSAKETEKETLENSEIEEESSEISEEQESSDDEINEDNDINTIYDTYSNDSSSITDIAVELHKKSCETKWNFLISCPYQLDYEDTQGEAFCVMNVDSLSEIIDDYCQVFAGDGAELNEKYFESDGKVYCYDGGRGANIYYKGTELILVSSDENSASFTAVSHYADPETNEPMDSKSYDFKTINDNGTWKTSEFTLPY